MDSILRKITIQKLSQRWFEQIVDIICLDCGRSPRRVGLPSWVVERAALWEAVDGNSWSSGSSRYLSTDWYTSYKACGGSSASVRISSDELTLTCRGYTFDVIRALSKFDRRLNPLEELWLAAQGERRATTSGSENELPVFHGVYGSEAELSRAIWLSAVHDPSRPDAGGVTSSFASDFQALFFEDAQKP